MKNPDLICYDFDGTLCNTLPDIVNSMNAVLEQNGFTAISEAKVRSFIGSGISKLVERSVYCALESDGGGPVDPVILKKVGTEMSEHYALHLMDNSHLYKDAADILDYFSPYPQIIVSNKPQKMIEAMLEHYGIRPYFDLVVGGDTIDVCKPDPAVWDFVKSRTGISGNVRGLMVGDSVPDMVFAKVAGLTAVAVTYGYNDVPVLKDAGADLLIDNLMALKDII